MAELIIMLKNVLIFVLLAIPGYVLVKTKLLKLEDSNVLSSLLLNIGMPFLVFQCVLEVELSNKNLISFLIVSIIFVLSLFLSVIIVKPTLKIEKDTNQKGVMHVASIIPNNGFLGIPLAVALYYDSAPIIISLIAVMNIWNNLFLLSYGTFLISRDKKYVSVKGVLTNPILIAFILGLLFNVLKITSFLPELTQFSNHLKNIVTPLSMIILGMKFASIKITDIVKNKKFYMVAFLKLILLPIFIVGTTVLISQFVNLSNEIIIAIFIGVATPTATLTTTLADKFNLDCKNASVYSLGTTLFSPITIPILYGILMAII